MLYQFHKSRVILVLCLGKLILCWGNSFFKIKLFINHLQIQVSEGVGTLTILVERAQGLIGDVEVEWRTEDGTAKSTGINQRDYQVKRITFIYWFARVLFEGGGFAHMRMYTESRWNKRNVAAWIAANYTQRVFYLCVNALPSAVGR